MIYFTRLKYNESYEKFQVVLKAKEKNGEMKLKIVIYTLKREIKINNMPIMYELFMNRLTILAGFCKINI
ncbi:hypothetical protein PMF13cell1_03468 [Blautia producta]|uniref:Uncharacterized protein n=1 Tax=Blautia producta TaxID=33035 RepID=A0A4P6M1E1_9FIRM|nr:hypothetical protein PMF13cell1_03468 [Blautia producta]